MLCVDVKLKYYPHNIFCNATQHFNSVKAIYVFGQTNIQPITDHFKRKYKIVMQNESLIGMVYYAYSSTCDMPWVCQKCIIGNMISKNGRIDDNSSSTTYSCRSHLFEASHTFENLRESVPCQVN